MNKAPLGWRWFVGSVVAAFVLTFAQAPGLTVADTKYDLAQNPLGFLARAAHLWSSQAPMGQVQNQAYGYFFPHGAFFSAGHLLHVPAWVTQRVWWALLLLAGFWGIVKLCETLGIGARGSRVIAGIAFALSPRVLTTLGSISSETLPMMLAPWVLLAPAALGVALRGKSTRVDTARESPRPDSERSDSPGDNAPDDSVAKPATTGTAASTAGNAESGEVGRLRGRGERAGRGSSAGESVASGPTRGGMLSPAGSALALALMGSVNAVATVAAFLPAALWWASYRPNRRWWRFTRAWIPLLVLATFWWVVPLLLLGKVSPPFLDYIESSGVTTQWAALSEVLRGTDSWTPFVSPERIAGAVLVTQPAAVLATGLLAAAGMAGLARSSMPYRGRFVLILCVGLAGICAGYVGTLGGPFAESVRIFLDSGGAPLRNVHKLEPLIRLPLVVGLAHLLGRVPLPASVPMPVWRNAFAHPERDRVVAVAALVLAALTLATSLAWTGRLAPRGAYDRVPAYWTDTARWLADNAADTRALVVPGAPFGSQIWGLTRDEPLQALASTPWAVRDSVPLNPPGTIRAMDSVQRLIADGRPSTGLATTLANQGIGIVVLRNDLDPETSRSTRPMLAHQAIEGSPGLTKVAEFGSPIGPRADDAGLVVDNDLLPSYPAIEIYRVDPATPGTPTQVRSGTGAPDSVPGAYTVGLDSVPVVRGGPEVLERVRRDGASAPVLLEADAARAGLPAEPVLLTDTPMDRESDFGRVDNHNSAVRAPDDARRTHNLVPDYPVDGTELVRGQWSGAKVTTSSSAADATQIGGAAPGSSTAAAVDGDPSTAWISNGAESALGQWLRLDLDKPITSGSLQFTTTAAALGDPVKWVEVRTSRGTVSARITEPGAPVTVALPAGRTEWVMITAARTETGTRGGQFGISELTLDDYSVRESPVRVDIRHRVVLPDVPAGTTVTGWDLGQEFPGRTACFDGPLRVHCSKGLGLPAEEPGVFGRTLSVPEPMRVSTDLTVRTRPGPALEALLTDPTRPIARGKADVADLRGAAFAATDGDPRTTWTAPEATVRGLAGAKPTLVLELPEPALVTGLDITTALGGLPATATSVLVNLGNGPQMRELPEREHGEPARISLHPTVTDRVEVSIQQWNEVLDRTALGFVLTQPAGLAEVEVLGPDYPARAPGDRLVTIGCEAGPVIAIGGRAVHTTVTATADELRSGAPVSARPCELDAADIELLPGKPDLTVVPTELFTVDRIRLPRTDLAAAPVLGGTSDSSESSPGGENSSRGDPAGPAEENSTAGLPSEPIDENSAADAPASPTDVDSSTSESGARGSAPTRDATHEGPASPTADPTKAGLLVLPLSTNVGWEAHTSDGQLLKPVVVDGWQQAWLVPAGTSGEITVSFPDDRWYRLAIFGGLLLLIPLVLLAIPRRRPVPDLSPAPTTWGTRPLAALGLTGAVAVVSGPFGVVCTVIAVACSHFRPAVTSRVLPWVAGVGTLVSVAALSTGTWRSGVTYMGGSIWAQAPAVVAVVAVGVAALPRRR
ncbi:alpha-(1-_3)-arabinofuranosyltransferase [Nocardia rosealba]|uniref:alpha-(1->3)-arabinofuranosyltransferase n=1 Tax=Nocardia rosealba TaxID=2878563 RepID=UPI001CD92695|nr:alpha-(1->3)-arabinofuranosyltransferase [Nocardia rosealba]MCA2209650.1 alpha-(1->3)-arabinofuranosyltransferase [Nocardia rosealba]